MNSFAAAPPSGDPFASSTLGNGVTDAYHLQGSGFGGTQALDFLSDGTTVVTPSDPSADVIAVGLDSTYTIAPPSADSPYQNTAVISRDGTVTVTDPNGRLVAQGAIPAGSDPSATLSALGSLGVDPNAASTVSSMIASGYAVEGAPGLGNDPAFSGDRLKAGYDAQTAALDQQAAAVAPRQGVALGNGYVEHGSLYVPTSLESSFEQSEAYLRQSPAESRVLDAAELGPGPITLRQGSATQMGDNTIHTGPDSATITWSPDIGVIDYNRDGSVMDANASIPLAHELSHAENAPWIGAYLSSVPSGPYDNLEEARVITGTENQGAIELGIAPRYDHQNSEPIVTASSVEAPTWSEIAAQTGGTQSGNGSTFYPTMA